MSRNEKTVPLKGSTKYRLPSAQISGEVASSEFQVTVMVRRKNALPVATEHATHALSQRKYLSREQLAERYGADPGDISKVVAFANEHNLKVVDSDAAKRHVILLGTPENYNRAFGVNLKMYKSPQLSYRGREGEIHIPERLSGIITSVTGLDNRPFAKPHFRVHRGNAKKATGDHKTSDHKTDDHKAGDHKIGKPNAAATSVPPGFSPLDLAKLYNFADADGTGQSIAILELGGGFHTTDLNTYFTGLGITPPSVKAVSYTGGGKNSPGTDAFAQGNPDIEVALDIEVAGGIAPGAKILVYFAPDASDQSFLGAMNAIVHDTANNPGVVSISWGGPE